MESESLIFTGLEIPRDYIFEKEEDNMKKKLLIVATVCASLFVVAPAVSVSAAEVESESQVQTIQNDDIGIAPCADEIVTKFRLYKKTKLQYRRWNQTRGYWVDKDWIDLN